MYKFLLCWRYLRTRWIAFASIISVTLGVATMIVVNSVMEGFRHEMQDRIHSILSDVVFESNSLTGFYDVEWHMQQIRDVADEHIAGMSATVVVPAMLSYQYNDRWMTRPVQLIGIDEKMQSQMGDLGKYLQHPENRKELSFNLRDGGYDTRDHQAGSEALERPDMVRAGWEHRRRWVERQRIIDSMRPNSERGEPVDPFGGAPGAVTPTAAVEQQPRYNGTGPAEASTVANTATPSGPLAHAPASGSAEANMDATENVGSNPFRDHPSPLQREPVKVAQKRARPAADDRYADYVPTPLAPTDGASSTGASQAGATAASAAQTPTDPVAAASSDANSAAVDTDAPAVDPAAGDPFAKHQAQDPQSVYDPSREQLTGVVLGIGLASYRDHEGRDRFLALPGDDVKLSFPTAGTPPEIAHPTFTVVDFYESKMSEYDASFVFVPIETLQRLRGMFDPSTKIGYASSIQIKLNPGSDGAQVRDLLRAAFVPQLYTIQTWRDKQGPLLAAVQMETAILNVLLFMIIAVAGFGILAIFFMIVVEKTRDIGILKSLGASRRGVQGIFLGYGLLLGTVGAGAGMVMGLLFVAYINEIADLLGMITGQEVFDPAIYYFQSIPTIVEPYTVAWIVVGALAIAVLASVLPARRASRLHPVEALRYE